MATMYSGMGGAQGYGEGSFISHGADVGNLDDGAILVDITSVFGPTGINYYGTDYTSVFINTNGNISFGAPNTSYDPATLTTTTTPTIAPFFVDLNISSGSGTGANNIYWDLDTSAGTFTVTWFAVDPYSAPGSNSFQLRLTDLGDNHWDMEFIYGDIQAASDSGAVARAGWTDGGSNDETIAGSGNETTMLGYESYNFATGDGAGVYSQGFQDTGGPICFAAGTRILTETGDVEVEALSPGDMVMTADHGPQPLRWLNRVHLTLSELVDDPSLAPVLFLPGALGVGLPKAPLAVSPPHRMLVNGPVAGRMFDQPEVLVPAKALLGLPGVSQPPPGHPVAYYHLVFDRHEVVFAEGAPSESLLPGPQALRQIGPKGRAAVVEAMPGINTAGRWKKAAPARPLIRQRLGAQLVARSMKNAKPLVVARAASAAVDGAVPVENPVR